MPERSETESRKLLRRLRDTLAEPGAGQERLDRITHLIADSMRTQVCSIYLFRDNETLELCATEGLKKESVHKTRMRLGEGLVGRVAKSSTPINTGNAPAERGFRYMPETGEEIYSSFLGVPIQRLGEKLGVLVVQSKEARQFSDDEVYALEVVAMVLAEMTELGAFVGEGEALSALHTYPVTFRGATGQEGNAEGHVWLHEPRVVITNPVGDDPEVESRRLHEAVDLLRLSVDDMISMTIGQGAEQREVLEAYRMFAHSRGWVRRMEEDIARGPSGAAAGGKEHYAPPPPPAPGPPRGGPGPVPPPPPHPRSLEEVSDAASGTRCPQCKTAPLRTRAAAGRRGARPPPRGGGAAAGYKS
jgi:phosphotransferase system enzyme I (PtsP)